MKIEDKYDLGKTLLLIAAFVIIAWTASGCAGARSPSDCVTWSDGSDPRAASAQNTECKSRERTMEVLRQATM